MNPPVPPPAFAHLADALETQARRAPAAVAVIDGQQRLTFDQLWRRSGEVAGALHRAGLRRGDLVGVFMEPSLTMVATVWGILRAGAAYVPLAVDYPEERLSFMVDDAGIGLIVADPDLAEPITAIAPEGVTVLTRTDVAAHCDLSFADAERGGDDLAYVIYTSGSTGRPKGVLIDNRAIVNQMSWLSDTLGLVPERRILFKTPTSFDAAQWELLACAVGATVVVAPAGTHRDPRLICELVQRHEVEMLQCVPTLWRALAARPELAECHSLRHLFSGGEVLSTALADQLVTALPNADLTNLYGPTEVTINATYQRVDPRLLAGGDSAIGIGGPVRGCSLYILDAELTPVEDGDVGELCIGGPQVAVGYLHRPELTAERFVTLEVDDDEVRLYRTGDLARMRPDGTLDFCGRIDDQIKVNGHRIETDEIRLAIERHPWVASAAVVPWSDHKDGLTRLAAFVQLDPVEAALMDQDNAADHHRSKGSHLQTKAQLGDLGTRRCAGPGIELPNPDGRNEQRATAFARKTYRHYEGRRLAADDLVRLADWLHAPWPQPAGPRPLDRDGLADVLRWLGPFKSPNRLLPKYAYASPGALNATQVYVQLRGVDGLPDGLHYYHPGHHALHPIDTPIDTPIDAPTDTPIDAPTDATTDDAAAGADASIRLYLVGLPRVITSVYADNVAEVLHFEAGHILGVLDKAFAEFGTHLARIDDAPPPDFGLDEEAIVSATLEVRPGPSAPPGGETPELLVQVHGDVTGAGRGIHRVDDGRLTRVTDDVVERRHVIAINQGSYDRASIGAVLVCAEEAGWNGYVEMGRALQKLQMNPSLIGLMSSGYSSLTGRNLASADRLNELLTSATGRDRNLSYFAVGGAISEEQRSATGMKEDTVHMRGPQEILRDDLRASLPQYMVPSRVELVDAIPISASGKVDRAKLIESLEHLPTRTVEVTPPRTAQEAAVARVWSDVLGTDDPSIDDDFFDNGGDSLSAVELVHALNEALGTDLPLQTVFDAPSIAALAELTFDRQRPGSRIVTLAAGTGQPIYMWPGLGGYPMNLRHLAKAVSRGRPVYGIQTHGLNPGETPYATLDEMIVADGQAILDHADFATVTLIGYSFGARMAAETAAWLDLHGVETDQIVLLAPGCPAIDGIEEQESDGPPSYDCAYFRKILASVFLGSVGDELTDHDLGRVHDKDSFLEFVDRHVPGFNRGLASRIVDVVTTTYRMRSTPARPLADRINRTLLLTARTDKPSFVHDQLDELIARGALTQLAHDHYGVLREDTVAEIAAALPTAHHRLGV